MGANAVGQFCCISQPLQSVRSYSAHLSGCMCRATGPDKNSCAFVSGPGGEQGQQVGQAAEDGSWFL
jgi:hypothetical protein